jgi:outer membrane protein assembly factor BamA
MQGSGMVLFSDVLGNHNLYLSADFNRNTENSNFFVQYDYLARRSDLGVGFYHFAYPFYSTHAIRRDRNFGLFVQSSYPLSRYNRFDFGADYMVVERSDLDADFGYERPTVKRTTVMPHIGYVHDTSIWKRSTAPSNGSRWRADMAWSPNYLPKGEGFSFTTFGVDWRKYISYKNEYSFGIRLSGGASYGADPQRFFMGGVQNWFNPRYDNLERKVQIDELHDIYYSNFIGPLRGVGYYNQVGSRYALSNMEFRFPFIKHLVFGWPLPIYIRDLQGALFTDWGAAWYPENRFKATLLPEKSSMGFGFGLRMDLGIFPIEWDVAWSHDERSNMIPQYYFSINAGF